MIRQNFHACDVVQAGNEVAHLFQIVLVVRHAGHQNVANPHFLAVVGEIARHVQNVFVAVAGQFLVQMRVKLLQIQHEQVGQAHQLVKAFQPFAVALEGLASRVDAGVDAFLLHQAEELRHEIQLKQRFTAGNGDAAVVAPVRFVADGFIKQLACRHLLRLRKGGRAPGVGVVAELAAQRTAVEKHRAANAGAVHQSKGFKRMDTSCQIGIRFAHDSQLLIRGTGQGEAPSA